MDRVLYGAASEEVTEAPGGTKCFFLESPAWSTSLYQLSWLPVCFWAQFEVLFSSI